MHVSEASISVESSLLMDNEARWNGGSEDGFGGDVALASLFGALGLPFQLTLCFCIGALYTELSTVDLRDVDIKNNMAYSGGAVYCKGVSSFVMNGCSLHNNTAKAEGVWSHSRQGCALVFILPLEFLKQPCPCSLCTCFMFSIRVGCCFNQPL